MRISIFGMGYVGVVSAACLAQLGHHVTGVDVSQDKVDIINSGHSPIIERDIDELIAQAVEEGRLHATTDALVGIRESEISLVCVGTPSRANGSLDLTYVKRVSQDIGQALAGKKEFHTIVLRSTVLPGTTEEVVLPILEQTSGKKAGQGFGLCFNPEFLREGTSVTDFWNPPFTVIGETDDRGAKVAAGLYGKLDAPLMIVPIKVAEMVKYTNNTFHALKVVFANEMGNICKQQGIDSHKVMEIFCMDTKLNLSPYYLKPGFAFGGSCLPKDLRALLHHARRHDQTLPVLEAILPSNTLQVQHGFELVRQTGRKKVGMLGFSFKAGTDDLRESPLVNLIEMLLGKGYQVKIYDRNVSLARLHGANRAYIEKGIPHIATLMCGTIEEVLSESEVIIIGNKSPEFKSAVEKIRDDQVVIDLVRIGEISEALSDHYEGIAW